MLKEVFQNFAELSPARKLAMAAFTVAAAMTFSISAGVVGAGLGFAITAGVVGAGIAGFIALNSFHHKIDPEIERQVEAIKSRKAGLTAAQ